MKGREKELAKTNTTDELNRPATQICTVHIHYATRISGVGLHSDGIASQVDYAKESKTRNSA